MRSWRDLDRTLGRQGRKNDLLLLLCCFGSVLLITAYVTMMRSPTVLTVLPEGGDSRKQVMMIFILAVIGCGAFTTYASGLYFRAKSRQTGVLMALGSSRLQLRRMLYRDVGRITLIACAAGALLGTPLAWGLWQLFRLLVVDSEQMRLTLDPQAYLFALAFSLFVIVMVFLMARRFLRRTNIIDIVNEARRSEPIREVKGWYGWAGLLLMAVGGFLGYMAPSFFVTQLRWYPPEGLTAVFYAPLFVGLYMVLLHTVVNGWRRGRSRYHNLIPNSMMKFQGRQTVRNMLVITVLLAGAYFASFYAPMLGTGNALSIQERPVDYAYHYRADQNIPQKGEVRALAEDYDVAITSWAEAPMARLAVDGMEHVETEGTLGTTWEAVYQERQRSELFLSESAWNTLTGDHLDLAPGTVSGIFDRNGNGNGVFTDQITLVTNVVTGETLSVTPAEGQKHDMLFGRFILDDGDYAAITEGLPEAWREEMIFFNVENCEDTYYFAKALFHEIVDRSGEEVEVYDAWDPVVRQRDLEETGTYFLDPDQLERFGFTTIDYSQRDSSEFRSYWAYMPQFRVLDQNDFVRTMAVFLMLFIFIAIICFAAVLVIAYTRSLTVALTGRQMYEDLGRLGASKRYLRKTVRSQISRVFFTPSLVGTAAMYALYAMILYFNGAPLGWTPDEAAGMGACLLVVAAGSGVLYGFYRFTRRRVYAMLGI